MNINEVYRAINTQDAFGYSPSSSSTKPAHIANGWFRRLLGRTYDPVLLNRTVVHWTKTKEVNPSEALLSEHGETFGPFRAHAKRGEFAEFRAMLRKLVSPYGGAVNNGNRFSSYNITHERHLTTDYSDNSTGAFLAHLVSTDLGEGPSALVELLTEILESSSDEVSTILLPLTGESRELEIHEGNYPAASVFRKRSGQFNSRVLRGLREGLDQLASFEGEAGGGLEAFRHIVAFGVFAVALHMPNRYMELSGEKGLVPHLLCFQEGERTTAYQASHYTYTLCRQQIENLYFHLFRQRVTDRLGKAPRERTCRRFIEEEVEFSEKKEKEGRKLLSHTFSAYLKTMGPVDALAEALREVVFRMESGTPLDFYRGIGVRLGFLRPAGNRATRKHFTLSTVLLEALLASVLNGPMPFGEFLDELYNRYGLLTGGRPKDAEILREHGVQQATVADLRANANAFREQLLALGWGRQYADGVMYACHPEERV